MIEFAQPNNLLAFPQKGNEWYTPARYIEAAREVMGGIDLDPASSELANRTVKAARFYTQAENGLVQPWYGNVWLNPPYSKTKPWIRKLISVYQDKQIRQALVLTQPWTETSWGQSLLAYPVCFAKGRLNFANEQGLFLTNTSRYATMFAYLGPHEQKFTELFGKFGLILKKVAQDKLQVIPLSLWEIEV